MIQSGGLEMLRFKCIGRFEEGMAHHASFIWRVLVNMHANNLDESVLWGGLLDTKT